MKRPRHPAPLYLKPLKLNENTGLYEIEEFGITYGLPHSLLDNIKYFFRYSGGNTPRIAEWYVQLPRDERSLITRKEGLSNQSNDDFYPDVAPE